jgi:hypothetical protein
MFENIIGKEQYNQPVVAMNNIRPIDSTCLKPEAIIDSKNELRSTYQHEQFLGWSNPEGLGRFIEGISISSLYRKIFSVFRVTMT